MSWVAAGVAVAGGVYKIASGAHQKNVAKRQAQQLEQNRPKYAESPLLKQQLSLAESELSGNREDSQFTSELDKDLSSSLSALTKMGGTPNDVASVFGAGEQGRARYSMLRSNLRLQKIASFQKALQDSEEDRQRAFGYNITAPYKDKTAANAASLVSAQGEISSGIDTAGSALASSLSTNSANNQYRDYFKVNQEDQNSNDILRKAPVDTSLDPTGGSSYSGYAGEIK